MSVVVVVVVVAVVVVVVVAVVVCRWVHFVRVTKSSYIDITLYKSET